MTRNEQIEEMAESVVCSAIVSKAKIDDKVAINLNKFVENMIIIGYRKIDDDCAVITKDDLNLYKKQAVKDTAKEICYLILEHWEKKQFVECDWLRVAIAEKYGVEVEE